MDDTNSTTATIRAVPTSPEDLQVVNTMLEAEVCLDLLDNGEIAPAHDALQSIVRNLREIAARLGWNVPRPWQRLESENIHEVIRAMHATLIVMNDHAAPIADRADAAIAWLKAADRAAERLSPQAARAARRSRFSVINGGRRRDGDGPGQEGPAAA